ncbi:Rad2 nuclease [Zygosaccharomyces mellis]|uniref:Rad2 nuclease n=1 Tax=Zygosaccharomyces mellis TaxID=42258 RepID=A0A4C2E6G8_9SACH|nr:Rad2 nuclease [Zygosaccharomyces mellis]
MGVQGFLPQLKDIQNPVTLRRYEGQTLGIDGYAWLHRAACSCAYELAVNKPTEKYLRFFIKKLAMLRSFKIQPYLVFDGDGIGVKKETESKRREKREESRVIAKRLWESGEKRNAMEYFQKCIDVTPEMAKCVVDYCKTQNIPYVVAPFEADAQMVYLEKNGFIQGILSEDSDLLIFGCQRLITKLNDFGECIEICRDDFPKLPYKFALNKLNSQEVRTMVCLAGCDYTSGIPKVGLVTAMKLVQRFRTLERILLHLQREGKCKIPPEFISEYELANFAFQYQRVFCPLKCKLVTLNEIPQDLLKCEKLYQCIGNVIHRDTGEKQCVVNDHEIHHEKHALVAMGELNPYNFHNRLINREHKLQLSSKSEGPAVNISTGNVSTGSSIDSFFQKSGTLKTQKRPQPIVPCRGAESKLDLAVKRRKLSATRNDATEDPSTSKFFASRNNLVTPTASSTASKQQTECIESEAETEIPDSEEFTQVPSSFVSPGTVQSSISTQEDDSDSLSELEEENKKTKVAATKSQLRSDIRVNTGSLNALQRFRYSSSQESDHEVPTRSPLTSKDVNKDQRGESMHKRANILVKPSARRTKTPIARPAIRSISSLSRFAYKG